MADIKKIKAAVRGEMKEFEPYFKNSIKSKISLVDIILNYIVRRKGKQMRPMLVFLSAKLTGKVTESTYTAASLIELLHTATLIHDDVVDDSFLRRGFFSIKALWKSKIAVLVGDYLLSRGLLLATEKKEFQLLEIASEAVREIAEGELLQIQKSRTLNITEEVYFEIIYKKTATLIAACTASGAKSAGASDEDTQKLKEFGKYAGLAFQIKDDLFDYEKTNLTGKPTGNDIQEKKMTLPLIYALKKSSPKEKRKILRIIRRHNNNKAKVAEAVEFVKEKGGIDYAKQKMIEYKNKAANILKDFSDGEINEALQELLEYITVRKK